MKIVVSLLVAQAVYVLAFVPSLLSSFGRRRPVHQQQQQIAVFPSPSYAAERTKHLSILFVSGDEENDVDDDDEAVRLVYDEWRKTYNKGDFDPERYPAFKANYEAMAAANAKAKEEANESDEAEVEIMFMNEYGDCTAEEYAEAMASKPDDDSQEEAEDTSVMAPLTKAMEEASEANEETESALSSAANALVEEEEKLAQELGMDSLDELEKAVDAMEGIDEEGIVIKEKDEPEEETEEEPSKTKTKGSETVKNMVRFLLGPPPKATTPADTVKAPVSAEEVVSDESLSSSVDEQKEEEATDESSSSSVEESPKEDEPKKEETDLLGSIFTLLGAVAAKGQKQLEKALEPPPPPPPKPKATFVSSLATALKTKTDVNDEEKPPVTDQASITEEKEVSKKEEEETIADEPEEAPIATEEEQPVAESEATVEEAPTEEKEEEQPVAEPEVVAEESQMKEEENEAVEPVSEPTTEEEEPEPVAATEEEKEEEPVSKEEESTDSKDDDVPTEKEPPVEDEAKVEEPNKKKSWARILLGPPPGEEETVETKTIQPRTTVKREKSVNNDEPSLVGSLVTKLGAVAAKRQKELQQQRRPVKKKTPSFGIFSSSPSPKRRPAPPKRTPKSPFGVGKKKLFGGQQKLPSSRPRGTIAIRQPKKSKKLPQKPKRKFVSSSSSKNDKIPILRRFVQNKDGSLRGKIFNSPQFSDGTVITTSPVRGPVKSGSIVTTRSGSRYRLS